MNRKVAVIGIVVAAVLAGGFYFRTSEAKKPAALQGEQGEGAHQGEGAAHQEKNAADSHEGHTEGVVKMTPEVQKQNGIVTAAASKQRLPGVIGATGKVEANADRIAHVSPRISGKIVMVKASLGDSVAAGQTLATLDSVELGEALNRYQQSKTKLQLAQSNMDRVKALVEKKIAARKEILRAETEYKTAQTELQGDAERLSLYGLPISQLKEMKRALLPVRSSIGGIITEKHAIVGELADPSKSLYTIADLSSVWVMVDINEKDLAKVHRGQTATVVVGAFPELKFKGRLTYVADVVDGSSRTVKARIEVANPGRKLKPEMFATVQLTLPTDAPPALAVPEDAVQELDGKKVVFVAGKGDEFAARPVETGRSAGGMIEITAGLKEGERYAGKGAFILKSEVKKGELEGDEHGH